MFLSLVIVDDDPNMRNLLERFLKGDGYENIEMFETAEDFLARFGDLDYKPEIDLVLMDVVLPDINGLEAVEKFKQNEVCQDIPVLAITAQDEPETIKEAFESGCVDYISKPLNKIELLARVDLALRLKNTVDELRNKNQQLEQARSKLEDANERLTELSYEDSLTGLGNKRKFNEKLNREWERLAREDSPLSLVMIDIDNFKAYNDRYGHEAGDEVLKKVGEKISEAVRRPADTAARYGGEEFILVLPDTEMEGGLKVAEDLRAEVEELEITHEAAENGSVLTISLGVATAVPDRDQKNRKLVKQADSELYRAKSQGRNRVCSADEKSVNDH